MEEQTKRTKFPRVTFTGRVESIHYWNSGKGAFVALDIGSQVLDLVCYTKMRSEDWGRRWVDVGPLGEIEVGAEGTFSVRQDVWHNDAHVLVIRSAKLTDSPSLRAIWMDCAMASVREWAKSWHMNRTKFLLENYGVTEPLRFETDHYLQWSYSGGSAVATRLRGGTPDENKAASEQWCAVEKETRFKVCAQCDKLIVPVHGDSGYYTWLECPSGHTIWQYAHGD